MEQKQMDPNSLNLSNLNIDGGSTTHVRPPPPGVRPPPPSTPQSGQNMARPPFPSQQAPSITNPMRPPLPAGMVRPPFMPVNAARPPMPVNAANSGIRPPMPVNGTRPPPMPSTGMRPPMPENFVRPPMPPGNSINQSAPPANIVNRPPMPNNASTMPPMPVNNGINRPPTIPMSPSEYQYQQQQQPQQYQPQTFPIRLMAPPQPQYSLTPGAPVRPPLGPPIPGMNPSVSRPPLPQQYSTMPQVVSPSVPQHAHQFPGPGPTMRPPQMPTLSANGMTAPFRPPIPLSPNSSMRPPPIPGHMSHPQQQQPMPPIPQQFSPPQVMPQIRPPPILSPSQQGPQLMQPTQQGQHPMHPIQPMHQTQPMYPQQAHQQQQPYPQQHQSLQAHGAAYPSHSHSGQALPGAPHSVSSSSHVMNEFYEPRDPLILPNIQSDFLTCSLGKIPRTASLLGKARTPFGLTVSFYPFGDDEKDRVAEVTGPIVRCRRCRTYLNPFAELIEQNSRWRCNICYLANEFPPNYDFDPITQQSIDRRDHLELKNFVYDFTNAPIEYTVRPPQPPVFVFALEVTAAAVNSGLFAASCRVIQEQLDSILNEDGRARIALITFDQRLQFYKITPSEESARVLVVADAAEPFLPACADLLVNLAECRSQLDSLLDQLPSMYSSPSKASPALGPVLQAGHMLLKSIGGKIVVINASLPTQFEGALKPRDDMKLLGTPKESTLLQPANQFYKMFASEIVKDQICIDLFVAPPQISTHMPLYMDLASMSGLTKYTGGKLHYYPEFGASEAISSKFCSDLRRFLGLAHGFEAVLRIRASQGISLSAYHGSFFLRQTDLLSLPNVNPDHSFSAQASIDENLQGTVVCFQAALLHTTCRGERRIRVINFSAPVTEDVKEIFNNMNVNGIAGILSKMAVEKVMANRLEDAREAVLNKCSDVIAAYKTQSGLKTNTSLLLPDNMRNFAITLHSLIKSVALRAGSTTLPDLRAYHLTKLKSMSAIEIIGFLLPRFYAIHAMDSECGVDGKLPNLLNLSSEKLERHGVFLLDNGFQQFLWLGSNVHPELLKMLFGSSDISSGRASQLIPELDNDWNRRLRAISDTLRARFGKNVMPEFFIVKEESDPLVRQLFLANLIEDRSIDGLAPSYAQWLMDVTNRVNTSSF